MYYYRARYYDAGMGRFVGRDPKGYDAGDANLYRYCRSAPLQFLDAWGEKSFANLGEAIKAKHPNAKNCTVVVFIGHTDFARAGFANLATHVFDKNRKSGPLRCWKGGIISCQSGNYRSNEEKEYGIPYWPTTAKPLAFDQITRFAAQSIEFGLRSIVYRDRWGSGNAIHACGTCDSITVQVWLDAEAAWQLKQRNEQILIPLLGINAQGLYGSDDVKKPLDDRVDGSVGVFVNEFTVKASSVPFELGGPNPVPDPTLER